MAGLTALKVKKAREPGKYHDGAGLILIVKPSGAASWVLRTMVAGRRYELGLGSREDVSLAEARDAARIGSEETQSRGHTGDVAG